MEQARIKGTREMRKQCDDRKHPDHWEHRDHWARLFIGVLLAVCAAGSAGAETLRFSVRIDPAVTAREVSGRVLVFLSQSERGAPRFGPDWFHPEPFLGCDVHRMKPGTSVAVDDRADSFPRPLSQLQPGQYRVQAVLSIDDSPSYRARGAGSLYSDVRQLNLDPAVSGEVELRLCHTVDEPPPVDSRSSENLSRNGRKGQFLGRIAESPEDSGIGSKEVKVRSERLSAFHGRDVFHRATVVLPPSYGQKPKRRYPTVYIIGGFNSGHRESVSTAVNGPREAMPGEEEFIRVVLDGQCPWGHHVFANSATNGPHGDALVLELIPAIDRRYRTVAEGTARFVTGHSSGGWASLWLQVNYPDTFGGVWSLAPDPVDFRDFQQVNLYAEPPLSVYTDPQGMPRPIARHGGDPVLWFGEFARMDDCLGRGGQLRSFEAVFSPKGSDGLPRKLWDRTTGQIDPETARAWQRYDLRLLLEANWKTLGEKLAGKLHVAAGELDTFYLDGPVRLLAESLRRLGSDAQIDLVAGASHGGVLTAERVSAIRRQMSEEFRRHHGQAARRAG
jgi:S-formylglutathione hydrolase FrmB